MAQQEVPLHGIITAMVTPLKDQTTLDHAGLERLIEHLIAGGVHGIFPLGTTGEAPALPVELCHEIVELTCRQVAGRVPVVIGVTDTSLVAATRLAQKAKDAGAFAIASAPPYYYSLTQDEILHYFEELVGQAGIPMLIYNQPGNTHHTISVDTVRRAAQIENIVGLKDSGLLMGYFHEVRASLVGRDDFTLLIGPDGLLAECVLLGGNGGMAAGSNVYPRLFVDLYNAAAAGDVSRVLHLHQQALAFGKAIYPGNNPLRGLKRGLELLGICSSVLTEPLAKLTDEESALVERYIDQNRSLMLHEPHCESDGQPVRPIEAETPVEVADGYQS
jgi:4-hydroxy-tetrahydrodipicolinate synthase